VYASGDPDAYLLPDDALVAFMQHCSDKVGDAYFRTPRTTIKAFCDLLAVLDQNPGVNWHDILGTVALAPEANPDLAPLDEGAEEDTLRRNDDDDLAGFRL
jgi:hypothetical protein